VFSGEAKTEVHHGPGRRIMLPLTVLAVLSVVGGFVEVPATLGGVTLFSDFLAPSFGTHAPGHGGEEHASLGTEALFQAVAAAVALLGIALAATLFRGGRAPQDVAVRGLSPALHRFWFSGFGFDALYHALLVRPLGALARVNRDDVVDLLYRGLAAVTRSGNTGLASTQTGLLRWYAAGLGLGALAVLTVAVLR
jgi:NADH-quinone oxidoreductase subunit L